VKGSSTLHNTAPHAQLHCTAPTHSRLSAKITADFQAWECAVDPRREREPCAASQLSSGISLSALCGMQSGTIVREDNAANPPRTLPVHEETQAPQRGCARDVSRRSHPPQQPQGPQGHSASIFQWIGSDVRRHPRIDHLAKCPLAESSGLHRPKGQELTVRRKPEPHGDMTKPPKAHDNTIYSKCVTAGAKATTRGPPLYFGESLVF
jgi:hypothetical protein